MLLTNSFPLSDYKILGALWLLIKILNELEVSSADLDFYKLAQAYLLKWSFMVKRYL